MDINVQGLDAALSALQTISINVPADVAKVLNKAAVKGRTFAIAKVSKEYYVDKGLADSSIKVKRASVGNLEASIEVKSSPTALSKFKISPDFRPVGKRQSGGVTAHAKRGGGGNISSAFLVRFSSGHLAVVERKTDARYPLKELYGPSVTGMVGADDNRNLIIDTVAETAFNAIDGILDGVGGAIK